MNIELLKYFIKKNNLSVKEVAEGINIGLNALYQRLNAKVEFKRSEMIDLKNFVGLSDDEFKQIFFN